LKEDEEHTSFVPLNYFLTLHRTSKTWELFSSCRPLRFLFQVFDAMAEDEVAPGVGAYTSLLQALAKDNDNARVPSPITRASQDKDNAQVFKAPAL